jgi:TRAP-type C4-dicarboxylate transport system substrate-binding protein
MTVPHMNRRGAVKMMAAAAAAGAVTPLLAQQVLTLRLHQFLPPQAPIPARALVPWAKKVEAESEGKLKIQMFHAMQMGGSPPQLFDQARDGIADLTWTVLGYTPGRFPKTEVFELPFMSGTAESSSKAIYEYVTQHAAEEFREVKMLAVHTHGPGLFHTKNPIAGLESLRGMKIRGGSRIINNMLTKLGAIPVGMPVPAVSESLSKGVIDGATIPWEVTPSLRVTELVRNHTGFTGDEGLFTQTFGFQMNRRSYDRLPAELKAVIDQNAGLAAAALFGRAMDQGDAVGREIAEKAKNNIVALDAAETARWKAAAAAVEADWLNEVKGKNIDGAQLVAQARALLAKHKG